MRGVLERALLVIFSVAFALVGAEVFLRVQEPHLHLMKDRAEWLLGRYRVHHLWHHWLRPNALTGTPSLQPATYPEPMIYRSNALGCRDDRQITGPAPAGTYRILVLGDSFTEGYYPEDGFASVLETQLNGSKRGTQYQVINCGTSSYSPLLHFLRYKHQLHRVRPDEVIVNIDLTDIYDDNVRYRDEAVFSEDGEPLSAGPARFSAQELMDGMRFRFYTARLFFGRPRGHELLPTEENVFAYHNDLPADSARWQQHVGFTIDLIRRLVETIRTSGARVTLTMYPYREQIRPLGGGPVWNRAFEARVAELAAELNVPFYSAYDDIRLLLMEGRKLYWTNDPHFNPDGQRAWSEAFARYYVTRMGTE